MFFMVIESRGAEAVSQSDHKKARGSRKVRDISVETFPSRLEGARDDWGLLPFCSRETTPLTDKEPLDDKTEIGFFSGNPFVEITKGILHLYKEEYVYDCLVLLSESYCCGLLCSVLTSRCDSLTLCIIGVPTSMTCHDLLSFTAPCHVDIAHIRILRDGSPNQYMSLLT